MRFGTRRFGRLAGRWRSGRGVPPLACRRTLGDVRSDASAQPVRPGAAFIDRSLNYGRAVVGEFLDRAGVSEGAGPVAVDLGAGHGDDLALARLRWPAAALHAIEAMPYHAELLAKQGLAVHRLDIERDRLPFDDESVDVIIANQILEHCKEVFWILHECARVMRVGGVLIVGVPNLASLHNRLLLGVGRQPTSIRLDSAHVRGFTHGGFRRLLDSAAPGVLRMERHRGSNFYPFPSVLARALARVWPAMAVSSFFLVRKVGAYGGQVLEFVRDARFETNYYVGNDGSRAKPPA